jgi:hypothetical protein
MAVASNTAAGAGDNSGFSVRLAIAIPRTCAGLIMNVDIPEKWRGCCSASDGVMARLKPHELHPRSRALSEGGKPHPHRMAIFDIFLRPAKTMIGSAQLCQRRQSCWDT